MDNLNSLNRNYGYNLRYDSDGKCFVSDETKNIMSNSQKNRYKSEEERIKQSETMKKLHEEHPEIYKDSYSKIAYAKREYRIAKCNKDSGEIIKIYEIIQDILDENPNYYKQAIKGCCQGTKNSYLGFR